MFLRFGLLLILIVIIARTFWRVVDGVVEGMTGQSNQSRVRGDGGGAPRSVAMARDPVCGTFVVPERAVSITDSRGRVYFCSDACRDAYRAHGRTA